MEQDNINNNINGLEDNLFEKCDRIIKLFPNMEGQIQESRNNVTYAINMLVSVNKELDRILILNQINNNSNEGMKKLEYIYNNILNKKDKEQVSRLNSLLLELKKLFKTPATTLEEIQAKLKNIETVLNQIDDFQNELSCKTLYKKGH